MTTWKLVPVEPTDDQMEACDSIYGSWGDHVDVYGTALAADRGEPRCVND